MLSDIFFSSLSVEHDVNATEMRQKLASLIEQTVIQFKKRKDRNSYSFDDIIADDIFINLTPEEKKYIIEMLNKNN